MVKVTFIGRPEPCADDASLLRIKVDWHYWSRVTGTNETMVARILFNKNSAKLGKLISGPSTPIVGGRTVALLVRPKVSIQPVSGVSWAVFLAYMYVGFPCAP